MQRRSVHGASKVAVAGGAGGLLTWVLLGTLGAARLHAEPPTTPAAAVKPATEPTAASAAAGTTAKPATGRDIADTLTGDDRFVTLNQALRTAGLVGLLKSKGPYTVFAPTEDAWKKLPAGTRDALLAQPAQLKAVLTYHIIKGRVDNVGLHKLRNALTMGGIVDIDYTSGVKINSAVVTGADLGCRNGIVHAIDKVLLPSEHRRPGKAAKPKPASEPSVSTPPSP